MADEMNYSHIGDYHRRLEFEFSKLENITREYAKGHPLPEDLLPQLRAGHAFQKYMECVIAAEDARRYLAHNTLPMAPEIRGVLNQTLGTIIGAARQIMYDAKHPPKTSR